MHPTMHFTFLTCISANHDAFHQSLVLKTMPSMKHIQVAKKPTKRCKCHIGLRDVETNIASRLKGLTLNSITLCITEKWMFIFPASFISDLAHSHLNA